MERRESQQAAWLLHARPYRETSIIGEYFTRDFGRVGAVLRGVRGAGRRRRPAPAQFVPLLLDWRGGGALKTLTGAEPDGPGYRLQGDRLASGLYLNELLMRTLKPGDAHEVLFEAYGRAVSGLGSDAGLHALLRGFEAVLLRELGYGISFSRSVESGRAVRPTGRYVACGVTGFAELSEVADADPEGAVPGSLLLAIEAGDFRSVEARRLARQVFRAALQPHLGNRPLHSRRLLAGIVAGRAGQ